MTNPIRYFQGYPNYLRHFRKLTLFAGPARLLIFIGAIVQAQADDMGGYQVEGVAVTQWGDGVTETRNNFIISVDGARWLLKLEKPVSNNAANNQSYRVIDSTGTPISYLEIGCDGVDTYMVRTHDCTLDITKEDKMRELGGDYQGTATGVVTPGAKPPDDAANSLAQVIWLAYVSGTPRRTGDGDDAALLYPTSVFLLQKGRSTQIPAGKIRVETKVGENLFGLPESIQFFAPGYETAKSLPPNARIAAERVSNDPDTGQLKVQLLPPFDAGYRLARYTVMERMPFGGGGSVPSATVFETFRMTREVDGGGSLKPAISMSLKVVAVRPWRAEDKNYFPRIAPGSRMQDKRLPGSRTAQGRHKVYLTRAGMWLTRENDGYKELAARIQMSDSQRKSGAVMTRVALAGLFLLTVAFFGYLGWRFRFLDRSGNANKQPK